jgi:hypothetical protein
MLVIEAIVNPWWFIQKPSAAPMFSSSAGGFPITLGTNIYRGVICSLMCDRLQVTKVALRGFIALMQIRT